MNLTEENKEEGDYTLGQQYGGDAQRIFIQYGKHSGKKGQWSLMQKPRQKILLGCVI